MDMIPCQQVDRIVRIEESVGDIGKKVDALSDTVLVLSQKIGPFLEKVEDHERTLQGSAGDIGLVAMNAETHKKTDEIYKLMRGEGEYPGIVGLLAELKKKMLSNEDTQKWLVRLTAGAIILSVIGDILKTVKP
jgi:hypothetical protein